MENAQAARTLAEARFDHVFSRPLYDSYCFSRIPWTIEAALAGESLAGESLNAALPADSWGPLGDDPDQIVMIFVDAFGWRFCESYAERFPFLARMMRDGNATRITSQFPSTTASHVTTLHTGLTPAASGIYEWFQYEPIIDSVIAPLLFSYAGERGRDGLLRDGVDKQALFDFETVHQRLGRAGVASHYVTPREFTPSPYNDRVCIGASGEAYDDLQGGLDALMSVLARPIEQPRFVLFYFGKFDMNCHIHGIDSDAVDACAEAFFGALEETLLGRRSEIAGRTTVILSADHGMIETDPTTTVYLNQLWPEVSGHLQSHRDGRPIVPTGASRDFFLHVRFDRIDYVLDELRTRLNGIARVYRTEQLVSEGLFGSIEPSRRFWSRVGNVVILPLDQHTVWWYEQGRFRHRHLADHGGLSSAEVEIPFLTYQL